MDILFILIIMLMLLFIAGGAVAWCYAAYRRATKAMEDCKAVKEAQAWLSQRFGEMETELNTFLEEIAHSEPEEATEADIKAAQIERQFNDLQSYQLKDYGIRFGGGEMSGED